MSAGLPAIILTLNKPPRFYQEGPLITPLPEEGEKDGDIPWLMVPSEDPSGNEITTTLELTIVSRDPNLPSLHEAMQPFLTVVGK